MKRFFLFLVGALLYNSVYAQLLQQGEMALVYFAPKNYVVLDFEYTEDIYEAGIYSRYAQSLLGITNAITETRTEYRLNQPHITTRAIADSRRAYKVLPEKDFPAQLLTIDKNGLLVGYNLPQEVPTQKNKKTSKHQPVDEESQSLPLTEDQLNVRSEEARAKAIAKQIFRLRETRMYLLSGELEHTPADGTAMKLVLNELQKEEEKLLRLFAGQHKRIIKHERIEFLPTEDSLSERRFLYFSMENGFTSSENIDAQAVTISLTAHRQQLVPFAGKQKKGGKVPQASPIIYNLPGLADIVVSYDGQILSERTLPIAQYGIDVPLARELFTNGNLPVIRMNTHTGNIISIQK